MEHLLPSVVRVERAVQKRVGGRPTTVWEQATDPDPVLNHLLSWYPCRLDLNFLRPGKDAPAPIQAGVMPDRVGIMFCPPGPLRAGDRLVTIPNDSGLIVVPGTFAIKAMPEYALDYSTQHHIEVQVVEESQKETEGWVFND